MKPLLIQLTKAASNVNEFIASIRSEPSPGFREYMATLPPDLAPDPQLISESPQNNTEDDTKNTP